MLARFPAAPASGGVRTSVRYYALHKFKIEVPAHREIFAAIVEGSGGASMDESQLEPTGFALGERLAIGIAAAGGLITAACISGLPATTCTALAETYGRAINSFGLTALGGLTNLAFLYAARTHLKSMSPSHVAHQRRFISLAYSALNFGVMVLAAYLFAASSFVNADNLITATNHCFVGNDAELAQRLHQHIELKQVFDWPFGPLNRRF
jgi:hypothetical protein